MSPRFRHRAAIPGCVVLNLLLTVACLVAYGAASVDETEGGGMGVARTATADALVLRAKIVGRMPDDPVARLFRRPQTASPSASLAQSQSSGSEPVRLVGIIRSEQTGGPAIVLVELADHRIVRLHTGATPHDPGAAVRQIGDHAIEVDLGSGRRVLTLN